MSGDENLDLYVETYKSDPYLTENELTLAKFSNCCVQYSTDKTNILELGIGHGITLEKLSRNFQKVVVLEGSSELVRQYQGKYGNVRIQETYFEAFEAAEEFDNISMGFILEHVDDPAGLLNKFRRYLRRNGSIYIGVPSASSLHRILAVKAGLLADLRQMSEIDLRFGHKRFLTHQDWVALLEKEKFEIVRAEGLYLKPFTTSQINSLNLNPAVLQAMAEAATDYPEISNSIFYQVRNK